MGSGVYIIFFNISESEKYDKEKFVRNEEFQLPLIVVVTPPPPPSRFINHPKFYGKNLISSHKKRRNRWRD